MTILFSDLAADERAILGHIANRDDANWSALTFKGLTRRTSLSKEAVRDACRSLRAKGLARHERGLVTEDMEFVGSGYTATPHGSRLYFESAEAVDD